MAVGCVANILEESGVSIFKVKINITTSIQTSGLFQNFKHDKMDSFLKAAFSIFQPHKYIKCNV